MFAVGVSPGKLNNRSKDVVRFPDWQQPLKELLDAVGPGLVTGASDDDPSGIGTYSMAGAAFGFSTLWMALVSFPLMTAVQFTCARIGMVTGMGLTQVLRIHYPRQLLYAIAVALLIANTINIGADLGAMAAAVRLVLPIVPAWLLIMAIAGGLLAVQVFGSYRLIARVFKWLTLPLLAYVATAFLVHIDPAAVLRGTFIPTFNLDPHFLSTATAILGTTISPYLFFWQADQEVEEQIARGKAHLRQRQEAAPLKLNHRFADITAGMFFSNAVMYFIILTTGATLFAHGHHDINTAAQAAAALRPAAGNCAFLLFCLGIVGTGFLAVPILGASAGYSMAQALGWKHGFRRCFLRARGFYTILIASTLSGVAINFMHINAFDALFWSAVINGVLAAPLLVMILLIANNKKIMGGHTNGVWTNALGVITALLIGACAAGMLLTIGR